MATYFLDTSAIVKRYILILIHEERGEFLPAKGGNWKHSLKCQNPNAIHTNNSFSSFELNGATGEEVGL